MRLILAFLCIANLVFGQQNLLRAGPMVGYSSMKEVQLWIQTTQGASVKIVYWDKSVPKKQYSTEEQKTVPENAFSIKLLADQLVPGKKYEYRVYINGKQLSFQYPLEFQSQALYQSRANAPDFSFSTGSCAYVNDTACDRPGVPFGGGYGIFTSMANKKADFMLWLGDVTYLREPDWDSKTGVFYRYSHTRSLPELQPLLASRHHYAIWDDHDYGPDDSDRSFWNKRISEQAFNTFWCNPNTNLTGAGGITGTFYWNDCQFFLMDDRWFRSPNARQNTERTMLGKEQIEWLLDGLIKSRATFKFICIGSQVLNPVKTKENYSTYPNEMLYLLKSIEDMNVPGVVFLSGDRHHTELTKLPRNKSYPLYDLTVSSLLSRINEWDEPNYLRVEGTVVREKNFGVLRVEGSPENRKLVIGIYNAMGNDLWTREITAKELK